jgi:TM2 domain-containing membrane protein YozV
MPEMTEAELMTLMQNMTEQQKMLFISQYNSAKKDRNIALILSVIFGSLGIDRFYVGDVLLGILKLLTGGCCGIWWIIDWFLIMGRVDEYNRQKAREIAYLIKGMASEVSPERIQQVRGQPHVAEPPLPQVPQPSPPPVSSEAPSPAQPQSLPANLTVWLEVVQGPHPGQKLFVLKPVSLVGRSSESDIQILEPSVSRKHFRIRFERGQFWLENESAQGTYVNGQPVAQWQPLKDGDYIQAGRVVLQFRMQGRA